MQCDLCGSTTGVATCGIYSPTKYDTTSSPGVSRITEERWEWDISPHSFRTRNYCDTCTDTARKKSVRHAALVFFLPTVGLMRLWKFRTCSREEVGDLMAASEYVQHRDPRVKHIIWPYGAEGVPSMEHHLTREGAEKRLRKKAGA